MRTRPTALVWIVLLTLLGALEARSGIEPRGVVTQVEGDLSVLAGGPRRGEAPTPYTPRPLDLVPTGSILRLDPGARIEVLCSTEHLVRIEGPREIRLDAELCRKGRRQPAGSFRGALPNRGRLVQIGDAFALELKTRAEGTRAIPTLLAPRNTALLDPTPELVWTATPGALEYEVRILGPSPLGSRSLVLEPPEAGCGTVREDWPGVEVCSLPWAEIGGSAELPPAGAYFEVGAVFALGADPRKEEPSPRAWTLPSADRRAVRERLRRLPPADEHPFLHAVLAARTLIEDELYDAAREELRRALELRDAPALRVTLGDLALETALPADAAASYERAADDATAPAVLGAALYGLGQTELALRRYESAVSRFERALRHFVEAGLGPERSAAVKGITEARTHLADR